MEESLKDKDTDTGLINEVEPANSEAPSSIFNARRFGSDVLVYVTGNALVIVFSFITILIIPKYLTLVGYGYWQLFVLYASYVGISHLGFNDGALLRWAGRGLNQVGSEIRTALGFLFLEQLAVIVPLIVLLYFILQPPLQWIGLMLLPYTFVINLVTFFTFTTQAVRKFKLLTVVNVGRSCAFLLFVLLLLGLGHLDYKYVIFASIGAYFLAILTFALWLRQYLWSKSFFFHGSPDVKLPPTNNISKMKRHLAFLWAYGKENINIGIFVLLGNFVVILVITMDRLIVSSFFPIEQFAVYAFALMVTGIIYTFVGAIAQVFFPNLSAMTRVLRARAYQLGKPAIIITWASILILYFPLARLIEFILPKYIDSLPIMGILMCTVGFGSLIQILHTSYYMVYRRQRQYFIWGLTSLALSVILNIIAIKVWGTLESVAIATLISFSIWYTLNELTLSSVVEENGRQLWNDLLAIVSYQAAFIFAFFAVDWFVA
ncbi:lipopolysaccharide biosynthesis protein, partial [Chloroflexota bacterium]